MKITSGILKRVAVPAAVLGMALQTSSPCGGGTDSASGHIGDRISTTCERRATYWNVAGEA